MGGTLSQCRCTEQHTPTGYVCETCGGMEFRERPAAPIAGVSREPISAEQWLAANFYINGLGELSFMHKTGCRYFSLPEVLEAYARAAARTRETKEKL